MCCYDEEEKESCCGSSWTIRREGERAMQGSDFRASSPCCNGEMEKVQCYRY